MYSAVGPVVEQQVLAKIALPFAAKTGRRCRAPNFEERRALADFQAAIHHRIPAVLDYAGASSLPEDRRGRNQFTLMVSPLPHFQIRAASQ